MKSIIEIYNYREMLFNLVKKDLRTRYKGSVMGFLWTFINPLLQLLVYSIVFSIIMRVDIDNFPIYLFIGLVPWMFFSGAILSSTSCIINNKDLIKKIYFPRIVIPISITSSVFMNMVYTIPILIIAIYVFGIGISWMIIFLPIIMLLQYFFVVGMCLTFSALNVYFRDLEHILGILMMVWFYLTPIVYSIDMIPAKFKWIIYVNPMAVIISAYRDILFYNIMPNFQQLGIIFIYSLVFLILGYFIFEKLQKNFVEEL